MGLTEEEIAFGYCHCGCGRKTRLALRTGYGEVKGQPRRFVLGHCARKRAVIVDRDSSKPWVRIKLTHGKTAIVDRTDVDSVRRQSWFAVKARKTWYACGAGGRMYLHRHLMGVHRGGPKIDHINGNPLDNRKSNLRICTTNQNQYNTRKYANNTSGFKGVSWNKKIGRWQALIAVNKKLKRVGDFEDIRDAALAYDQAARELHGEFARLNFPKDGERAA